jgi:hypothetical protein
MLKSKTTQASGFFVFQRFIISFIIPLSLLHILIHLFVRPPAINSYRFCIVHVSRTGSKHCAFAV